MRSIVCLGGASVDRKFHLHSAALAGTSNPARATRGFGGVARNVAENLARLGIPVSLLSRVGADEGAAALLEQAARAGIDTHAVLQDPQTATSEYSAILDAHGDLVIAAADARAIEGITPSYLERVWPFIERAAWLFLDCNLPADVIAWCITRAERAPLKIAVDAVSDAKALRLPHDLHGIDLLVLNRTEAFALRHREPVEQQCHREPVERPRACRGDEASTSSAMVRRAHHDTDRRAHHDTVVQQARHDAQALRERGAASVLLTMGTQGLVAADENGVAHVAAVPAACADATGAGDALVGAVLYALLQGEQLVAAARTGVLAAALTVESPASVRPDLSRALLAAHHHRLEPSCTKP